MHTTLFIPVLIGTLAAVAYWIFSVSRRNVRRAMARCDACMIERGVPNTTRGRRCRKIFMAVGEMLSMLACLP